MKRKLIILILMAGVFSAKAQTTDSASIRLRDLAKRLAQNEQDIKTVRYNLGLYYEYYKKARKTYLISATIQGVGLLNFAVAGAKISQYNLEISTKNNERESEIYKAGGNQSKINQINQTYDGEISTIEENIRLKQNFRTDFLTFTSIVSAVGCLIASNKMAVANSRIGKAGINIGLTGFTYTYNF